MKKFFILLCLILPLSACNSLKFWGDDSEDTEADVELTEEEEVDSLSEPKELEDFDESVVVRKLWRSSAGDGQKAYTASLQPAISGDYIFSADPEGRVSAFMLSDGDRVWRTDLDISLTAGVGVGGDLVLVGSPDGEAIALAADTGEEIWRSVLSSEVLAPPAANRDIVVVQTQDGKVHGLSPVSGELIWHYATEIPVLTLRGTASPLLLGNAAVMGFASGKLVALNPTSGELLWETRFVEGEGKTELERMVDVNTPVLASDIVYATSYQGKVGALSRGAGRELWSHNSSSFRPPSYRAGQLYIVDTDDKVHSYRASHGGQVWVNDDLMRRKLTRPLALEDHLAVADREGYLHILSVQDGRIVGRIKVDGDGVSVAMIEAEVSDKSEQESESAVSGRESFFVLDNSGDLTAYQLEVEDDE